MVLTFIFEYVFTHCANLYLTSCPPGDMATEATTGLPLLARVSISVLSREINRILNDKNLCGKLVLFELNDISFSPHIVV